jgi:flagellum-specific ATP synthase
LRAQVIAVSPQGLRLTPFGSTAGVRIGDTVRLVADGGVALAGDALAGRAVDPLGRPLDGGAPIRLEAQRSAMPSVLDRIPPSAPFATGIRAIDGLLTVGKGQRIGIFAASGVGKTRLIEQIVRQTESDRLIVCLIGERGREVEAFWSELKASDRLSRTTIIAATSDESAPMRALALEQALTMAEFWRDRGEHVLLVADSITRHAMALREIGLVAGEPPMLRAYTPNVLRELPRIVERCGAVRGKGAITGLFTVLSEADEVDDPIVEVMKSLLDGHIVLSRRLAEAGHFPAIDINRSISRLFDDLATDRQREAARSVRASLAKFEESRILVESGMYKPGSDRELDGAIAGRTAIAEFLKQPSDVCVGFSQAIDQLASLLERRG